MSSRTSDFYARAARRPLALPDVGRLHRIMRTSKAKSITRTQMQRSPRPKVKTLVTTKHNPTEDKGVRLVNIMRRRLRNPMLRGRRNNAMEYVRTPSEGNSTSYFTRKALRLRGFKKRMLRNSPLQMRRLDQTYNMTWAYGRQAALAVIHNSTTELQNINALVPGTGGTGGNTTQMLLQSTKIHYIISSGSKAGIKLRIYEGCYKRDAETAFTPTTFWINGMLDTGSTESVNDIDSKPWSSPQFTQNCHISKVTNLFLPQGRTHEHYVTYRYNKIYSREIGNTSTNREYLKGWTRFVMFVAYGEPVADTDADITTASGRLIMVMTKTQRFRYNTPQVYQSTYIRGIPITGVTSERLLDEGSGEIETVTNL